jgi:hypothetical protein
VIRKVDVGAGLAEEYRRSGYWMILRKPREEGQMQLSSKENKICFPQGAHSLVLYWAKASVAFVLVDAWPDLAQSGSDASGFLTAAATIRRFLRPASIG